MCHGLLPLSVLWNGMVCQVRCCGVFTCLACGFECVVTLISACMYVCVYVTCSCGGGGTIGFTVEGGGPIPTLHRVCGHIRPQDSHTCYVNTTLECTATTIKGSHSHCAENIMPSCKTMTSSQGKITRASSFGVFGGRQSPADTPDAGIVSKSKLESRYELLRTMTLPLSLSIPNTVPGFSPIPSAVCGTPLPTPGHSSKPPSLKMKSLPQDWRLCTSIQFQSPTKFEVLSCPGTSVGKGDGVPSPSFQFQENMKYWNYPDVPLSSATVTVLRNAKDSGTASFLQSRLARWLVGFRSVVDGLYNGTIPYFYVQVT